MHYRLATLSDPVLGAIVDAARHALSHADTVHHDAQRLQKKTGCCVPTPREIAGMSCCAPQTTGGARTTLKAHF
jgi:hypothetical protein